MTVQTTSAAPPSSAPAATATAPDDALSTALAEVERRIAAVLTAERDRWAAVDPRCAALVEAVTTLSLAGGKLLRPRFCLLGYLAAGGDPECPKAVDAAVALELLHSFALLRDDVLDDAPTRRGTVTAHERHIGDHTERGLRGEARRYGEGIANLAADLAHIYADRFTRGLEDEARAVWDELRIEVTFGQYLDIAVAAEGVADPELSRWIAVCKSGRYTIHRPLQLGAALAGRTDLADVFEGYGLPLGEAFQFRDDMIDAFGTSADTGKPAGLDFAQFKMSYLLSLGVRRDDRIRALAAHPAGPEQADRMRELLVETGVAEDVEQRIAQLVEDARKALADAPLVDNWRTRLTELTTSVAYRDR
ncbi:polyprenyl synthetase family protein [Streptomyces sp. N2-109]|uniref:Polyprenyl synthetase family protein n=1 Tax=Streptomyces gossypii TaxID=2883101 RepID=A0ABT2JNW5_9ACTN|nr:polyprenyl synthetase family protein [Streptomyces gossypii]MCT2589575.1 polyprenyl synthetase family protein [Streptomyces gossypii]